MAEKETQTQKGQKSAGSKKRQIRQNFRRKTGEKTASIAILSAMAISWLLIVSFQLAAAAETAGDANSYALDFCNALRGSNAAGSAVKSGTRLISADNAANIANYQTGFACAAQFRWPVRNISEPENENSVPLIVRDFENPPQPWLPGHRGVDLETKPGTAIYAPCDGIVSFAGKVAGKDVMSIKHQGMTSTFEPALTTLKPGDEVTAGQQIATADGMSDHCADSCLHWGVKTGEKTYINPVSLVKFRHITLKRI
ncbi:MAG: M23 family metallopeptidase [Bifidobacteriaceae bacterium]|nr:M23 family metallopeptidase [Bifidobacteriaceae bacterium]